MDVGLIFTQIIDLAYYSQDLEKAIDKLIELRFI